MSSRSGLQNPWNLKRRWVFSLGSQLHVYFLKVWGTMRSTSGKDYQWYIWDDSLNTHVKLGMKLSHLELCTPLKRCPVSQTQDLGLPLGIEQRTSSSFLKFPGTCGRSNWVVASSPLPSCCFHVCYGCIWRAGSSLHGACHTSSWMLQDGDLRNFMPNSQNVMGCHAYLA